MVDRLVYGSLAVLGLLTAVAADAFLADTSETRGVFASLFRHGSVIPVLFTVVMVAAVFELRTLLARLGRRPSAGFAAVVCAVLMLSPWLAAGEWLGTSPTDVEGVQWQLVWIVFGLLGTFAWHVRRGVHDGAVADMSATLFVIVYLGLLPSFAVQLRSDVNHVFPATGAWTLLIVLAIAFSADIGALYVGSAIGRRKLAPSISPGKTVEGYLGGVASSVAVACAFWAISLIPEPTEAANIEATSTRLAILANMATGAVGQLSLVQTILFGTALSVATQLGDLFESLLKRVAQVKDSSKVMPGMGGILDVVDGVIFAVPVAWLLLTRVWQVV